MITKRFFYMNPSNDPYKTLALEEYLVENIRPGELYLYLYVHDSSVIIGKNQNAWAECRHELLTAEGGKLARRISGGGAVYHDPANLNFSFIVSKDDYDLQKQLSVICEAVRSFGIDAGFSGRNDILADGAKFSGNAFCFKKNGAFHHGTLLIGVDKDKMARYLSVSRDKIASKGIASVRSRTCNLNELCADVTNETMAQALQNSFRDIYGEFEAYAPSPEAAAAAAAISEKNASWEWIFGNTPSFDIVIKDRFVWGGVEICLNTRDAYVTAAKIYSDAMDVSLIEQIASALPNTRFSSAALCEKISSLALSSEQEAYARDIIFLIKSRSY